MSFDAAEWLEFIGGSTPYREAVRYAFQGGAESLEDSVEVLASKLEVHVSVVFCTRDSALSDIKLRSSDSDRYVIAVIPDLDLDMFHQALLAGAYGVVWEDTPTNHLAAVTRAALHGDMLLPAHVLFSCLQHETPSSQTSIPADLDPASLRVLNALSAGDSIQEIAAEMSYSDRTIQRKVTNLCLALGAQTPAEAVHLAHRKGFL